jgi:hypothetical protein
MFALRMRLLQRESYHRNTLDMTTCGPVWIPLLRALREPSKRSRAHDIQTHQSLASEPGIFGENLKSSRLNDIGDGDVVALRRSVNRRSSIRRFMELECVVGTGNERRRSHERPLQLKCHILVQGSNFHFWGDEKSPSAGSRSLKECRRKVKLLAQVFSEYVSGTIGPPH